ncbi:hypothetical protein AVEN_124611-1 [Araneus ventricosus]|uniref:Uncharacterized protein n=1 Tax=Araneus ventricosus TaxID=182803 RepID=A0A4Y2KTQ5_ARAVE|nr:hypothetical protein AVEN_124611-1 [Araneus ventricosus]
MRSVPAQPEDLPLGPISEKVQIRRSDHLGKKSLWKALQQTILGSLELPNLADGVLYRKWRVMMEVAGTTPPEKQDSRSSYERLMTAREAILEL